MKKNIYDHLKNMKPGDCGIVHSPFIPVMYTESEREERLKKERAGKKYATVKQSNSNPFHRGKRGQILETLNGGSLLEIETVNRCDGGFCTLIAMVYPNGYEKIWFDDSELESFEEYDENGELKK